MAKGSTGGSMNGRLVYGRPKRPQLNEELCSECAAVRGQPCIKESWEKAGRGHRYETHRAEAARRGFGFPLSIEERDKMVRKGHRRR